MHQDYNLPDPHFYFLPLFQVPAQTEMPAIPKFLQVTPQFCTGLSRASRPLPSSRPTA